METERIWLIALSVVVVILAIALIVCFVRYRMLYVAYDYFMRGSDAESLEETIMNMCDDIETLRGEDKLNKDAIRALNKNFRSSYQKLGVVKYNAFKDIGGTMSFALALLDFTNTGFVINSVHSREGCYMYVKRVDCGKTEVLLGDEEKQALEEALGYNENV